MVEESTVTFDCAGERLFGILHRPQRSARRGVLIVVGGPQYRAGSHRQFTLLARALAARGIPVMRFDYRGMGDSEGALRDFSNVGEDLRAAVGQFCASVAEMTEVVLWGLCDGATAAGLYAAADRRIAGVALLNPWIRTDNGIAKATLKHYYRRQLLERAFWAKLLRGRFNPVAAMRSAWLLVRAARSSTPAAASLPERLLAGLDAFDGRVLIILSGADLTAQEFAGLAAGSGRWRSLLAQRRFTRHRLEAADHTCSRRQWQDQVAAWTHAWIVSW